MVALSDAPGEASFDTRKRLDTGARIMMIGMELAGNVQQLIDEGAIPEKIALERTRDPSHGDFASNLALMLAKPAKLKPPAVKVNC